MFLTVPIFQKRAFVFLQESEFSKNTTPSTTVPRRSPGLFLAVPTPIGAKMGHLTPILGQVRKKTKNGPEIPYSFP